jgi:hypothetical protein
LSVQITDITEGPVYLLGWDPNRTGEPDGIASTLAIGTAATVAIVEPDGVSSSSVTGSPVSVATIAVTGISAGTGAVGTPSVVAPMQPDGIASTETFGTAVTTADMNPDGVGSAGQVGTPSAFNIIKPTGIDAEGGGTGTPTTTAIIHPTGIPGGETFGDTDILATVFVIPGPVDPSNDFGNPIVTQKRLIFRPPTQTLGWGWYKRFEGISLIKKDGAWSEVPWPTNQDTLEADIYLAGGRDHAVSTTLAAELISEGYTISEEY